MSKGESISISAEEHNATRRAKKAAQKANARTGKGARTSLKGTYFEYVEEERRIRRDAALASRERQRSIITPLDAALKAPKAPCLVGLTDVALRVVVGTLDAYVSVVPDRGMGRTKAAFEAAKRTLAAEEARRYDAVNLGYRKTREALDWAYAQIRAERGLIKTS
jgi:hypothetical protein